MCAGPFRWRSISAATATRLPRPWPTARPSALWYAPTSAWASPGGAGTGRRRGRGSTALRARLLRPGAERDEPALGERPARHADPDRRILQPDGLFLAAMLGGGTFWQLRQALTAAESEVEGGLSPRVSPFADLRDAAGLLQRRASPCRWPTARRSRSNTKRPRPDARPGRHGREQSGGRAPPRLRPARHALRAAQIYDERFARPSAASRRASRCCSCTAGRRTRRSPSRSGPAAPHIGWRRRSRRPSSTRAKKRSDARS